MLEVAITSLKCALRDDYPEFMEFYEAKPWLPEEATDVEESVEEEAIAADDPSTETTDENDAEGSN